MKSIYDFSEVDSEVVTYCFLLDNEVSEVNEVDYRRFLKLVGQSVLHRINVLIKFIYED